MLAPLSADDIPPITAEAMASVQAGLVLLAKLVGDREHNLYLASSPTQLAEYRDKAGAILLAANGLAGILRVQEVVPPKPATPDPRS